MRIQLALEVAEDIFRDFDDALIPKKFDELVEALQQQINSPNEQTQLKVVEVRDQIFDALDNSRFNDYPPSLDLILDEMDVRNFLGKNLKQLVANAFEGNDLTPASVKADISQLRDYVAKVWQEAEQLGISARYFEMYPDDVEFNEYEFSIVVPRNYVDNELDDFGTELKRLNKTFSVFNEIATGSREDFKIRAISSSELSIFLDSLPATALVIVTALERLAAFYEKILNIIVLQRQVKNVDDMPSDVSDGIKKYIDDQIEKGLDGITSSLENEFFSTVEKGRKNELRTEVRKALTEIANRYDNGFLFDVRGGDPKQENDDDESDKTPSKADLERFQRIQKAREKVRLFRSESEPVLKLTNEDSEKSS
ncbi:MAG: hypothetical protein Pars2KO_14290 [Parasphingorhabdus sp.]